MTEVPEVRDAPWWRVLMLLVDLEGFGVCWEDHMGQNYYYCPACGAAGGEAHVVAGQHKEDCPFRMAQELVAAIRTPGLDTRQSEGIARRQPGEIPAGAVPFADIPTQAPFYRLNARGVPDTSRAYRRTVLPGQHAIYNARKFDGGRVSDAHLDPWELVQPHTPFHDLVVERVRDREVAAGRHPAGALPTGTIAERTADYIITTDPALACLHCGSVSRNLHDIEYRYCAACKQTYELPDLLAGDEG